MRTYLECIPCFFRQALHAASLVTDDDVLKKQVVDAVAREIPHLCMSSTPPEMAAKIYAAVADAVGEPDPYIELKKLFNAKALRLYPQFKQEVAEAADPLLLAIRFAVGGNIIDYGPDPNFSMEHEFEEIRTRPFARFDYDEFRECLRSAEHILYLGDNAGEIVFDRLLIETLDVPVVFAVRGAPAINDALLDDADEVGMHEVAEVISNGAAVPGTALQECSRGFRDRFDRAPLIIAKGQGNYETLSGRERPIFFLLKAKCPVIAQDLGVGTGDIVLASGRDPEP